MFQLVFLIAYKVFLMFLAFLSNFLFLCSPGRHRAVYILNAFGFINRYLFSQTSTSCYVSPHSSETVERFSGLPHCVSSSPNAPSDDSYQN